MSYYGESMTMGETSEIEEQATSKGEEMRPDWLEKLPLYVEYQKGGFLIIQAVIEVFFDASRRLRRSLREIAASLEDSGGFEVVEHKVETVGSVKRPVISLLRDSVLVVLSDSTIRATMSGSDLQEGASYSSFTQLKSGLKYAIDRIRASISDKKLNKSFARPPLERMGTRIDYITKLDQPRVRGLDKYQILNSDWLSKFAFPEDKLAKFTVCLTPDYPRTAIGTDTTISIDRVDKVEVELQLGRAKIGLELGPVARFSVIRGYLGEPTLNLERISDTQEFAAEFVLQLVEGGV